jgi:hypothetical protein
MHIYEHSVGGRFGSVSIVVFWGVTPRGLVGRYQRIGGTYSSIFRVEGDEVVTFLLNVVTTYKTTRRHDPASHDRHLHCRESLRSQLVSVVSALRVHVLYIEQATQFLSSCWFVCKTLCNCTCKIVNLCLRVFENKVLKRIFGSKRR